MCCKPRVHNDLSESGGVCYSHVLRYSLIKTLTSLPAGLMISLYDYTCWTPLRMNKLLVVPDCHYVRKTHKDVSKHLSHYPLWPDPLWPNEFQIWAAGNFMTCCDQNGFVFSVTSKTHVYLGHTTILVNLRLPVKSRLHICVVNCGYTTIWVWLSDKVMFRVLTD